MPNDNTTTIRVIFETREAADRALDHLVQQHVRRRLLSSRLQLSARKSLQYDMT